MKPTAEMIAEAERRLAFGKVPDCEDYIVEDTLTFLDTALSFEDKEERQRMVEWTIRNAVKRAMNVRSNR